jgi:Uma2 family endonuclease
MSNRRLLPADGPFRADQLRCGDPYELRDGHPVECLPGGGRHSKASMSGGLALGTDPDADSAGFDTGYTPNDKNMRAPDIAIGNVPDEPGWVKGVPPLAVEYADVGQDEDDLKEKIRTLLEAGTRYVWVVRLTGMRRVEVHAPKVPHSLAYPGPFLEAPGVLRNPVPVEALYDPQAAQEQALRNLLQRRGFADLDAVREEGREEGLEEGREEGELALVLRLIERRIGPVSDADRQRIRALDRDRLTDLADALGGFHEGEALDAWLRSKAPRRGET